MGNNRKRVRILVLLIVFLGINLILPLNTSLSPENDKSDSSPFKHGDLDPAGWQPETKAQIDRLGNQRFNVVFLGIDARARENSRSDSIMVLSINPQTLDAAAISVLRDTYVNIPPSIGSKYRINTAFALGGAPLSLKTVSNFLQVSIEYYVAVDFQAFEKAVDTVGGVEVDVEKPMDYQDDGIHDIHLKPGKQVLNGAQALGYARFRHDEQGDFARVERQRKLLQALLAKARSVQGVCNLPKVFEVVRPYVDTNLDWSKAAGLIYLGCKIKHLASCTVPYDTDLNEVKINGMDVLVPNTQHVRTAVRKLLP